MGVKVPIKTPGTKTSARAKAAIEKWIVGPTKPLTQEEKRAAASDFTQLLVTHEDQQCKIKQALWSDRKMLNYEDDMTALMRIRIRFCVDE